MKTIKISNLQEGDVFTSKKSENIIDVAYDMLCWCIENGYIKKEGE